MPALASRLSQCEGLLEEAVHAAVDGFDMGEARHVHALTSTVPLTLHTGFGSGMLIRKVRERYQVK